MKKFTCTLALLLALLFGLSCLQPSALAAEGVGPCLEWHSRHLLLRRQWYRKRSLSHL